MANCVTLSMSCSMPEMKVFKAIALKDRPQEVAGLPVRIEIIERMPEWFFSSRQAPARNPCLPSLRGAGLIEALDGRLGLSHQLQARRCDSAVMSWFLLTSGKVLVLPYYRLVPHFLYPRATS
jgi:hypothetical protein